ncbi:MAG: hypothetical protein M1840_003780 [Geoglossum simile]|nr:MAG: hypothetical protein M1840_003780 [Geoglossum simile]
MARFTRSATKKARESSIDSRESMSADAIQQPHTVPGTPSRNSTILAARSTLTIDTSGEPITPTISTTPLSATPTLVSKSPGMNLGSKLQKSRSKHPRVAPGPDPEAPPLFQAYPQAIKHASLSAPTLSAEAILKHHSRRGTSLGQDALRDVVELGSLNGKREEKAKKKHKRKTSSPITSADWTNKVYVLLTSGCLLQYAGDGSFDRLPERVMQLGKDSVAFASDVIPGKHWVLQVSQDVDREGELPPETSKSLFSKLSFRSSETRKFSTSLLLVLDNPEDLHSWMFAVRQEIELLGGTRHKPEAGMTGPKVSPGEPQLRDRPSRRYLITRDPNQISQFRIQRDESLESSCTDEAENRRGRPGSGQASLSTRRQSSLRPSIEAPSVSTTAVSYDQNQLDHLRESRLSCLSTGTRTLTSRDTSPDDFSSKERASSAKRNSRNTHPSAINPILSTPPTDRRRSTNTSPSVRSGRSPSGDSKSTPRLPLWQSTYERGFKARSPSPSTPNFSVPNYNAPVRYSLSPRIADVPPIPVMPQPENPEDPSAEPKLAEKRSSSSSLRPVSTVGSLQSATDWTSRKSSSRNTVSHNIPSGSDLPSTVPRTSFDIQSQRQSVPGASRPSTSSATSSERSHSLFSRNPSTSPRLPPQATLSPSFADHQRPVNGNAKKARRPASLQSHPHDFTAQVYNSETTPNPLASMASYGNPPPRSSSRTVIHNRKSMPLLALPPPPMPPPNCPLPAPPPLPSGESVYLNVQGVAREGGGLVVAAGGAGGEVRKLGARHSFCAMRAGVVREGAWV